MKKYHLFIIIALTLILLLSSGCQKREKKEELVEEEIPEPVTEVPEASVEEIEAFLDGYITFLSGDVNINRGSEWEPCDVDDFVGIDDSIKTEMESFCEVQFTDFGMIRIQENTEVTMKDINLKEEQNKVDVNLANGDLLCKVKKLRKGDKFQVSTKTALAGVRGTEFVVKTQRDKATVIAVKEGKVAVIPSEVAEKIEKIKKELKTETAKQTLEEIALPEIIVTDEKEVKFEPEHAQKAVEEFEEISVIIEEKIKEIDEKAVAIEEKEKIIETMKEEEIEEERQVIQEIKEDILSLKQNVVTVVEEKVEEVVNEVFEEPAAASETSIQDFEEIKKMKPKDKEIILSKKEAPPEAVSVQTKITIKVTPKDAKIFINDEELGRGKIKGIYTPGTVLIIKAELEGYITQEKEVEVLDQKVQEISIELKKDPVIWSLKADSAPLIRKIVVSGNRIIAADANGKVFCFSTEGKNLWSVSTENDPNENSMPAIIEDRVIFSGSRELLVIDMKTGDILKRLPIGKGDFSSHLFGRRVVQYKENIIYPSDNALLFLDKANLNEIKRIEIPGNSNSSPAVYDNRIILVNQNGILFMIDPETDSIESRIKTEVLQPVGIAPTVRNNLAVFAGSKGTVFLTDLKKREIIWQKKVEGGKIRGVFQDIAMGKNGVYPYNRETFLALSIENGKELFNPVYSTSAPLYSNERLYYGNAKAMFLVMNASTGKIIKSYKLDSAITLEPAVYGNNIVVATKSGTLYLLSPDDM